MVIEKNGMMFVLSSPSGAGKTTLTKKLADQNINFSISISHTTRKPRPNEIDGKDYYFVNKEKFENLIKQNDFFEYAKIFDNHYGTLKKPVLKMLSDEKDVLFDIDWQGAKQIKEKKLKYKLITFFILPPSKKVLFERLSSRDMKDKLIVEERMRQFSKDVLHWADYDYVVINDNLENCYKEVNNLIKSEVGEVKNFYDVVLIKNHINQLIN